jgi:hypothetical protein
MVSAGTSFTPANFKTVKDNVDQAVGILNARKEKGFFSGRELECGSRNRRR